MDAFRGGMKLCIHGQPPRPFSIEVPKHWLDKTYAADKRLIATRQANAVA